VAFDLCELVADQCGRGTRLTGMRDAWALTEAVVLPVALARRAYGIDMPLRGLLRTELRVAEVHAVRPGAGRLGRHTVFETGSRFSPDQCGLAELTGRVRPAVAPSDASDRLQLSLLIPAHLTTRAWVADGTWACHPRREAAWRFA